MMDKQLLIGNWEFLLGFNVLLGQQVVHKASTQRSSCVAVFGWTMLVESLYGHNLV